MVLMRVYLDICCLKRPFDDQAQARIAVETAAVLAIMRECEDGRLQCVRSIAHDLENAHNTDGRRAAAVAAWLATLPPPVQSTARVRALLPQLRAGGLKAFDAFHVAWAVELGADVFVSTDDRLLIRGARTGLPEVPRMINPASFIEEVTR